MKLTLDKLRQEAIFFIKNESEITHNSLIGVTDGKAVGTYIEHRFQKHLKEKYDVNIGSSAQGIDLPDKSINTDIKVTSVKKPQSSSPFKSIEQKVYGLDYNLLVFVYEKTDTNDKCYIDFKHCIFLEANKTADYNLTKTLIELTDNNCSVYDIVEVLQEANVPGDDTTLVSLARKIISNPPNQGYLTISNAFQWRLKYNNILSLDDDIDGVYCYNEYNSAKLGDYQTPLFLTDFLCDYLKNDLKILPEVIVEPTCGISNFLKSSSKFFPDCEIYGIDIDKNKLDYVNKNIPHINLINEDIFTFEFDSFDKSKSLLILGNPPQITNKELSNNNLHKHDTVKISNLDISEHIILKLINEFKDTNSTIALLCKTTTSRNVFIELVKKNIKHSFVKQLNFNSSNVFKLDDATCFFIIQFGGGTLTNNVCEVADISNPSKIIHKYGFKGSKFYSNINDTPDIDGSCQFEWRHGVKHDCARVMELVYEEGELKNKNNSTVSIENHLIYPMLKSGDLKKPIIRESSKYIIITQKNIKQDTSYIKNLAPETWKYLNDNKEFFDKRKSSIYNNTPDFSIFGIGDYSFKKFKVAISGFYKKPIFSLVYSEKTMMLDDACYFLSFDDYDNAYITMLLLNSDIVKKFLKNIAFIDSKRPYSKKVLKRVDFKKSLSLISFNNLKDTEKELELNDYLTSDKFNDYKNMILNLKR